MKELDFVKTRSNSETSNESEEFSMNTSNIDYTIYDDCKRSKLKIIFMHRSDLSKNYSLKPHHNSKIE